MSDPEGFRRLTTDPADLEAYIFGTESSLAMPIPLDDPSRRLPPEERAALVHLPDGTIIPHWDYHGWPFLDQPPGM